MGARTGVGSQLAHDLDVAVLALEVVDGAHVVQTATGHHVPRGGIGTGHDP